MTKELEARAADLAREARVEANEGRSLAASRLFLRAADAWDQLGSDYAGNAASCRRRSVELETD